MLKAIRFLLLSASAAAILPIAPTRAEEPADPPPYGLIRSLQAIQDSIVLGDHSASEMQRFILGNIDNRLRNAPLSTFDDPRNVDAAFVYAMSGGNPQTLAYLANRDIEGNFDTRIVDALSHYLAGKGGLMTESLEKTIPEYRNSRIGPYLYLVLANAKSMQDPTAAIGFYDWARLTAPGTNIEEAALRRSLALVTRMNAAEQGFSYALKYARRFITSPYASQFADIFVELAVTNYSEENRGRIEEILGFFDKPRQREVYLRIARRAAIGGLQELASLAAGRAQALSDAGDADAQTLANLYSGLVNVPSTDVLQASSEIGAIPDDRLSSRDRQLRDAASFVAQEVLRRPDAAASLTQASAPSITPQNEGDEIESDTGSGASPFAEPAAGAQRAAGEAMAQAQPESSADPELDVFLSTGRSKLDEIDSLLKGDN